ncbi:MAG: hypothetical protein ACI8PZ_004826 [Myxococcota bacterium]|jgi:hypothetical protein
MQQTPQSCRGSRVAVGCGIVLPHAVGAAPGEGPCRAWLGGYCLGLERPVGLAARAVADGDGRAQFSLPAGRWVGGSVGRWVGGSMGRWVGAEYCYQAMVRRGPMGIASGFSEVLCVEHCSVEDDDDDGICNAFDVCPGGRDDLDGDGDGICDALDLCPDDVGAPDEDGDGVCDTEDLCPGDDAADEHGDGVCDGLDLCPGDDAADEDGDGICDGLDFGDGIGFDALEWTGTLRDVSVSPDGSVSLLAETGGELYVTCYSSDGSAYAARSRSATRATCPMWRASTAHGCRGTRWSPGGATADRWRSSATPTSTPTAR